ncbi:MAG: hypothetical protein QXT63_01970 [Thermoplasmata archaeon]
MNDNIYLKTNGSDKMDIIIPYYSKDNGGHDLTYTLEQAYNSLKEKGAVAWGRRAIKAFSRLSMELTMKKKLNVIVCEAGKKEVRYRFKVTEMWQKSGKYDLAQIRKYLPSAWGPHTKEHVLFFKVVEIEMYKTNKKLKDFIDIDGNPVDSLRKGRTDYVLIKDDTYPAITYDPEVARSELKKKDTKTKKIRELKKETENKKESEKVEAKPEISKEDEKDVLKEGIIIENFEEDNVTSVPISDTKGEISGMNENNKEKAGSQDKIQDKIKPLEK